MNTELKICGTQIWVGTYLFSEGLSGPAYADKLREAERWIEGLDLTISKIQKVTEDTESDLIAAVSRLETALRHYNREADAANLVSEVRRVIKDLSA